jgi:hypothetical protein
VKENFQTNCNVGKFSHTKKKKENKGLVGRTRKHVYLFYCSQGLKSQQAKWPTSKRGW